MGIDTTRAASTPFSSITCRRNCSPVVTMRAVELAAKEGIAPAKVYWTAVPRSVLKAGMEEFRGSAHNPFEDVENVEDLPFGTPDEEIAAYVDGHEHAEAKAAALRAHRTQIPDSWWMLSIADNFGSEFMGMEFYTLAVGEAGPRTGLHNRESDLFAGLSRAADGNRTRDVLLGQLGVD